MARMLDMAVVAKFPGARLAFLVSREFLFCLRCLHVWSLALWSAASTEPQAQPLLLRCMPSHMLLASGDPTVFFITQLWLWLLQNWVLHAESLLFLCHHWLIQLRATLTTLSAMEQRWPRLPLAGIRQLVQSWATTWSCLKHWGDARVLM